MSDKTKLSPVKGRLVQLEDGSDWPSKADKPIDHEVVMTRYYRRRVRDGDLRDKKAEVAAAEAAKEAEKLNEAGVPGTEAKRPTADKTRKAGK